MTKRKVSQLKADNTQEESSSSRRKLLAGDDASGPGQGSDPREQQRQYNAVLPGLGPAGSGDDPIDVGGTGPSGATEHPRGSVEAGPNFKHEQGHGSPPTNPPRSEAQPLAYGPASASESSSAPSSPNDPGAYPLFPGTNEPEAAARDLSALDRRILRDGRPMLQHFFEYGMGRSSPTYHNFQPADLIDYLFRTPSLRFALGVSNVNLNRWQQLVNSEMDRRRSLGLAGYRYQCDEPDPPEARGIVRHLSSLEGDLENCEGRRFLPALDLDEDHRIYHKICSLCKDRISDRCDPVEADALGRNLSSGCGACTRRAIRVYGRTAFSDCRCKEELTDQLYCLDCREQILERINQRAARRKARLLRTRIIRKRLVENAEPRRLPACRCGKAAQRSQRQFMFCRSCDGDVTDPGDRTRHPPFEHGRDPRGHYQ